MSWLYQGINVWGLGFTYVYKSIQPIASNCDAVRFEATPTSRMTSWFWQNLHVCSPIALVFWTVMKVESKVYTVITYWIYYLSHRHVFAKLFPPAAIFTWSLPIALCLSRWNKLRNVEVNLKTSAQNAGRIDSPRHFRHARATRLRATDELSAGASSGSGITWKLTQIQRERREI